MPFCHSSRETESSTFFDNRIAETGTRRRLILLPAAGGTLPESSEIALFADNTYYHYGQDDEVTAPGLNQTLGTTIADVSYILVK